MMNPHSNRIFNTNKIPGICLIVFSVALVLAGISRGSFSANADESSDAAQLIDWLLEDGRDLEDIPFADVVQAVSGKRILPVDTSQSPDREIIKKLGEVLDRVLERMNDPDNPVHQAGRINEASSHFEQAILEELNRVEGFHCEYPKNASGRTQRSGYPDLRLTHTPSGRVLYLDPKLYKRESRNSSLRTFYFTPKKETNKILDDAHHLIIGFAHEGKSQGHWRFVRWELVDLSHFKVRLKAEFQGSNRDLYQPDAIVATGSR